MFSCQKDIFWSVCVSERISFYSSRHIFLFVSWALRPSDIAEWMELQFSTLLKVGFIQSVLNSVAHLVCWTVAEGQDRGERQIPQILGLGASQPPRQHPACASILFTGSFSSHMSPFFLPTGDTSGVFFTNISFCVHLFHFRWFKSKSSGDRKEGEICTGVLHFSHSLPKWPMHCILFSTVRRFWREDKKTQFSIFISTRVAENLGCAGHASWHDPLMHGL